MVGKRRLNKRHRRGQRVRILSRRGGRDDSPSSGSGCAFNFNDPTLEPLNQERNPANSMGRLSDCQSRKTPPTRKTRSASQTPAAGERRPWRAKDTPIKEIE